MAEAFKGTIKVDIRERIPDWTPFEPPKAPGGVAERPGTSLSKKPRCSSSEQ